MRDCFEGVVGYHGCRPEDIGAYYRHGLQLADHDETDRRARVFFQSRYPEITDAIMDTAIASVSRRGSVDIDNRRCYLCSDERYLLEQCGQYLIYGCERRMAIASALGSCYQQALKQIGVPTILSFAVPFSFMSEREQIELAQHVERCIARPKRRQSAAITNHCLALRKPLPAIAIIRHCHPFEIVDRHDGMHTYVWTQ
jgi:hypothetical protein